MLVLRMRVLAVSAVAAALTLVPSIAQAAQPATPTEKPSVSVAPATPVIGHAHRLTNPPANVDGPTDHYVQGMQHPARAGTAASVYALPFNFTFTGVSWGIDGREWVTSSGKACLNMQVRKTTSVDPETYDFGVTLYTGSGGPKGFASFPYDGNWWQYCFTGLSNGTTYHFFYGDGDYGNGAYFNGNGNVQSHS